LVPLPVVVAGSHLFFGSHTRFVTCITASSVHDMVAEFRALMAAPSLGSVFSYSSARHVVRATHVRS
jgi:hypothetical protein